jgi:hypothetical protein
MRILRLQVMPWGDWMLRHQRKNVSLHVDDVASANPALSPLNLAIAGSSALFVVFVSWFSGWAVLTMLFLGVVVFVGTLKWLVMEENDGAAAAKRLDEEGSFEALLNVYDVKLRIDGISAAFLGANAVFAITQVVSGTWLMTVIAVAGFVGTAIYLQIAWQEIDDVDMGEGIRHAWPRHIAIVCLLGASAMASHIAAASMISRLGKSWPKALAFGFSPRVIVSGYIGLGLAALVWLLNRWLAQRAALVVVEQNRRALFD